MPLFQTSFHKKGTTINSLICSICSFAHLLLIWSLICLFVHSFVCSFIHSLIASLICSLIHLLLHSFIHFFIFSSFVASLICCFICSFIDSFFLHSFVHFWLYLLVSWFVHSLLCSFSHILLHSFGALSIHLFVALFVPSFICWLLPLFVHCFVCLCICCLPLFLYTYAHIDTVTDANSDHNICSLLCFFFVVLLFFFVHVMIRQKPTKALKKEMMQKPMPKAHISEKHVNYVPGWKYNSLILLCLCWLFSQSGKNGQNWCLFQCQNQCQDPRKWEMQGICSNLRIYFSNNMSCCFYFCLSWSG